MGLLQEIFEEGPESPHNVCADFLIPPKPESLTSVHKRIQAAAFSGENPMLREQRIRDGHVVPGVLTIRNEPLSVSVRLAQFQDVDRSVISIEIPTVRQHTASNCGPACLSAVARFFDLVNIDLDPEAIERQMAKAAKTTKTSGTSPADMVEAAERLGLEVIAKEDMTPDDLRTFINAKIPVICDIQAWGRTGDYAKADAGHYAVAIGCDDDNLYLQDPALDTGRGFLSWQDFEERWHDKLPDGTPVRHWGMALNRPKVTVKEIE